MEDKKEKDKPSKSNKLPTVPKKIIKKIIKRGRPKGSKNKADANLSPQVPAIPDKSASEIKDLCDLKGKMTAKELKFLELYVSGYRVMKAMKEAGFVTGSNTYRYLLAKKIIEKYERSAEDHRNIFRSVGLGEIAVAKGILKCCQTAKTDKDRREAWALAAKCLGLQREVIEGGASGVAIYIGAGPGQPAASDCGRPNCDCQSEVIDLQPAPAPKPLMITK